MTSLTYTYSYGSEAEARLRGEILLAKMGPAWTLRVHENLGWHYNLGTANLNLSEHADGDGRLHYSVLVGEYPAGFGHWSHYHQRGEPLVYDPIEAVTKALTNVRSIVERDTDILHAAEATLLSTLGHADLRMRVSTH